MFAPRLARIAFALLFALSCLPAQAQDAPGARMRVEAQALIAAVDAGKRSRLVLPLADPRRADWHYTPRSRPGLALGELDATQREAVHRLLRSALSAAGHRKVVNIIELELVLREIETFGTLMRGPEKYSVVIFGAPGASQPWGWRFEGHHLSLNFTLSGDAAAATSPSFFGANPAEVRKGPRQGLRALAREEDEARQLLGSLDGAQRSAAIVIRAATGTSSREPRIAWHPSITGASRRAPWTRPRRRS